MTLVEIYCPPIPEDWQKPPRVVVKELGSPDPDEVEERPGLSDTPKNIQLRAYRRDNADHINAYRRGRYTKKRNVV